MSLTVLLMTLACAPETIDSVEAPLAEAPRLPIEEGSWEVADSAPISTDCPMDPPDWTGTTFDVIELSPEAFLMQHESMEPFECFVDEDGLIACDELVVAIDLPGGQHGEIRTTFEGEVLDRQTFELDQTTQTTCLDCSVPAPCNQQASNLNEVL